MGYDGSVKFDARIDTSKFKGDLQGLKSTASASFKAIGVAAGSIMTGISAAGISFESAFAGVKKTVNATAEELDALKSGIRDMAKEIPTTATEIAGIAESAGQLGIETKNILGFTRTMADLGVATNLAGEEAASTLAKFANITQMPQEQFSNLGSTIVALGNNLATTEADIAAMSLRLAGAGSQAGLSEAQILSFAGALSSVGIEAEAGGSAFSRVMTDMQLAVETSNSDLKNFATVANMSASEFKNAFKKDAAGAILAFINGLNDTERLGMSATEVLSKMGIEEIRLSDALKRAAGASDVFNNALKLGNQAWEENTALTKEAEQRYATTESKLKMLGNQITDLGVEAWDSFSDAFGDGLDVASDSIEVLADSLSGGNLSDAVAGVGELFGQFVAITSEVATTVLPPLMEALSFVGENFTTVATAAGTAYTAFKAFSIAETIATPLMHSATVANDFATAMAGIGAASARGITVTALFTQTMTAQDIVVGVLTGKIGLLTAAKMLATKAQLALNAAWSAHPIGLVVAGVTVLTGALLALSLATQKESEEEKVRKENLDKLTESVNKNADAVTKAREARERSFSQAQSETNHIQSLASELENLQDAEGRVTEANKARAQFIIDTLNNALGTDIQLTNDLAVSYGNAKDKIYELIEAKRAEALASAYDAEYQEALKNQAAYTVAYGEALTNAQPYLEAYEAAQTKVTTATENYKKKREELLASGISEGTQGFATMIAGEATALAFANGELANAEEAYGPYREAVEKAKDTLLAANSVISQNEQALARLASGDTQGAVEIWENMSASAKVGAKDTGNAVKQLGTSYVSAVGGLEAAMDTFKTNASQESYNAVISAAKKVESARTEYEAAGGVCADGFIDTLAGDFDISSLVEKINSGASEVKEKANAIGIDTAAGTIEGMDSQSGAVNASGVSLGETAVEGVATGAETHSPSRATYQTGLYIDQGLADGILAGSSGVISAAIAVAKAAIIAANNTLLIQSPSKVMYESGAFFDEGFANGIKDNVDCVVDAASYVGESAAAAASSAFAGGSSFIEMLKNGGAIRENPKGKTEKYDAEKEKLDYMKTFGLPDAEYYQELSKIRDEFLEEGTKEWYDATADIFGYQKSSAEDARDHAFSELERLYSRSLISEKEYLDKLLTLRDSYYEEGSEEWLNITDQVNDILLEREREALDKQYRDGLISAKEYYDGLTAIRDNWFAEGSSEWLAYSDEISEGLKSAIMDAYTDIFNYASDLIGEVTQKQETLFGQLKDYGKLTKTVRVDNWYENGDALEWTELKNFGKETEVLRKYKEDIEDVRSKLLSGGYDESFVNKFISQIAEMSVEEGAAYASLLSGSSSEDFYDYIAGYKDYLTEAEGISKHVFQEEFESSVDNAFTYLKKKLEEAGFNVPDHFLEIGKKAGASFGEGFGQQLTDLFAPFMESVSAFMPDYGKPIAAFNAGTGTTVYYNFYHSEDTTAEQIQAAQNASEFERLSGGYN